MSVFVRPTPLLLVLAALFSFLHRDSDAQQLDDNPEIRVMSYNIHYAKGMDGEYDLQRIADVIINANPDIVGLQEISNLEMAKKLEELTGMKAVFGPSLGKDTGYGDAILCKHSFKTLPNESLPSASSSRYQALAIDVDLSSVFGEDSTVRFVTAHFDWLKTLGSQYARLASVEVIEKAFFEDCPHPGILTGDFNATPESAPLQMLEGKGWFYDNFGKENFTHSSEEPEIQIDYVMVRGKNNWQITSSDILEEPLASDHLPVVMNLRLLK